MSLTWFCKHCQVEGSITVEALISTQELSRLVIDSHEQARKTGGYPWVLLSIDDGGTVTIDEHSLTLTLAVPPLPPAHPHFSILVLHVQ